MKHVFARSKGESTRLMFTALAAAVFTAIVLTGCNEVNYGSADDDTNGGVGSGYYTLTVTASPSGSGTVNRSPNQTSYNSGEQVYLIATPASGYVFSHWTGVDDYYQNEALVYMSSNRTITAVFTAATTTYTLTTSASPSGGGTINRSPNQTSYNSGTSVLLTATPASGYVFSHWTGVDDYYQNEALVYMSSNRTVTAVFTAATTTYTLTTSVSPSGGGTVGRSPNQTSYNSGTWVTLTATPASGYTFTRWEGLGSSDYSSSNYAEVYMSGNRTVTAVFTASTSTYTLTLSASPSGGGYVDRYPSKTSYSAGEWVEIAAEPASGYAFSHWTGLNANDYDLSDAPDYGYAYVYMNSNRTITAVFTPISSGGSRSITVVMRDSYGDGWNGAALRISVNGVNLSTNPTISSGGSSNTYTFTANSGDAVSVYWVSGSYNNECAFAIYYTNAPPSTTFNPASGSSNNTSALLVYRQYGGLTATSTGTLLGSFTVQ